jgi:ubiquinone/menaquinone biosynthesis C-methylase UbiE
MSDTHAVLGRAAVRAYYDRFGTRQDSQAFYEDPATDALVTHADFEHAQAVFEFGCGTGRLARRLLDAHLPDTARYVGNDLSPVMTRLARRRIESHAGRAGIVHTEGEIQFPFEDGAVDRVVSCYVLDLLADEDIRRFMREACRVLRPGGYVCLASLGRGVGMFSRLVSWLWSGVFRIAPSLVGGCRPIDLDGFVDEACWRVLYRNTVSPFGVPSQVRILERIGVQRKPSSVASGTAS